MLIFRQSKKTWLFFRFPEKIRPNGYCLWKVNLFFYMQIISFICWSVNLSRKIALPNAGCVLDYFGGGHKKSLRLQFRSFFKNLISTFPKTETKVRAHLTPVTHPEVFCLILVLILFSSQTMSFIIIKFLNQVCSVFDTRPPIFEYRLYVTV